MIARWFGSPVSAFGRYTDRPSTAPYTLIWLAPPVSGDSTVASRLPPTRASRSCATPYSAFTTRPPKNHASVFQ